MAVDPDTQRIKWHVFPRGKANDRTIKWGHRPSRSEATRGQEEMWKIILEDHITQCLDTGLELSKKTTLEVAVEPFQKLPPQYQAVAKIRKEIKPTC